MKKSELQQIIKEEISKVLKEENTGLITFEQIKQACVEKSKEYTQFDFGEKASRSASKEIMRAKNMKQLINVLDGMGFNGEEAYEFVFDAIVK
jgi:hypothetical protein